jgi:hypothetical protein
MADTERSEVGETPVFTDIAGANNEITCNCCCKIKLKLEEALSELSSAKEIIKLVQEEINFSTKNSNVSTDMSNVSHGLETNQAKNKFES